MGPLVGATTELSKSLMEAGNNLLKSHSSTDSILTLLDEIESVLISLEQVPTQSIKEALIPSKEALVSDDLIKSPDSDVRVSVVSCITEIMRISAPESPYEDEKMKDIFEATIEAFGRLADTSGRSYKRIEAVIDTVAKVRSVVVMMDLECDDLILDMFRKFLKLISPDHPEEVRLAMETIMITVIDESEVMSSDLVQILLACVKKDCQDVSPMARGLVEKVLNVCASKLKPHIWYALKLSGASLDMYSPVVLSICGREYATTRADEMKSEKQVVPSVPLKDKLDSGPSLKGNRPKKTLRISNGWIDRTKRLGKRNARTSRAKSKETE